MSDGPKIDLHTHSTCSDGSLSPSELVEHAAQAGVGVLALTDHDSVAGLDEAQRAALTHGLILIPGAEISAAWRAQTLHILALWVDPAAPALQELLAMQVALRNERLQKMCARLSKMRLPGEQLLAQIQSSTALPTRSHLAQAMVEQGLVSDAQAAFRKYLGQGKGGYVSAAWPELEKVVATIRAAGGVAVLAHPARYKLSASGRRAMLKVFVSAGGTGIEVVCGGDHSHVEGLADLAIHFGLQGSVGSDFHHPNVAWNPLGRSLKLPDRVTPVWRNFGL